MTNITMPYCDTWTDDDHAFSDGEASAGGGRVVVATGGGWIGDEGFLLFLLLLPQKNQPRSQLSRHPLLSPQRPLSSI